MTWLVSRKLGLQPSLNTLSKAPLAIKKKFYSRIIPRSSKSGEELGGMKGRQQMEKKKRHLINSSVS